MTDAIDRSLTAVTQARSAAAAAVTWEKDGMTYMPLQAQGV